MLDTDDRNYQVCLDLLATATGPLITNELVIAEAGYLPLGVTDASVIAIAERHGVAEIATLDRRHFRTIRPAHCAAFTLLPDGVATP